jgi:Phage tail repeat like/Chaperone of endosialidase
MTQQTALVSFSTPVDTGGSPITSYTVTANPGGIVAIGNISPILVTGLSSGISYSFTVTATNAAGTSLQSANSPVIGVEIDPYYVNVSTLLHIHVIGDVENLQTTLDDKAGVGHIHVIGDVENLQTTLDDKAGVADFDTLSSSIAGKTDIGHSHVTSDITGLTTFVQGLISSSGGGSGGTVDFSSVGILPQDNFGLGLGAFGVLTTGSSNVGIGSYSLSSNTSGFSNIGVGYQSLSSNIDGYDNIAIGYSSSSNNTTGNENIAIGSSSLLFNTTGAGNTAIGRSALMSNTIGNYNTGIGGYSLQYNIDGYSNVGIGNGTLQNNTTGFQNIAIGNNSGNYNTTGSLNTVMGDQSFVQNTTGYQNTAIGSSSLTVNSTGFDNTAVGAYSLLWNTGNENTAVGVNSLNNNQLGNFNTSVGANSLLNNQNGSNNVAVGYSANQNGEFDNTTCLGYNTSVTNNNQVQLGSSGTTTYVYGTVQNRSDLRDKADVRDTVLGLDFINKLRPVDYKWDMREDYKSAMPVKAILQKSATSEEIKANDLEYRNIVKEYIDANKLANLTHDGSKKRSRYHHGLIAQDVKQLIDTTGIDFGGLQDHSKSGGEDVLSIGYDEFIAPLIKAVQELSLKVLDLETRLSNK